MRILFVHNAYLQSAGGEDATVEAEMNLLIAKGNEVQAVYFNNDGFKEGLLNKMRGGIRSIYNSEGRKKVREAVNSFRPDIIHVHNFFFNASPAVFFEANKQGVPVVATLHNYRLICVNALLLRNSQVCELCVHSFFPVYGVKYACYHDSKVESAVVGTISTLHKVLGTWKKRIDRFITPADFSRNRLVNSSLHLPPDKVVVKRNFVQDPGFADAAGRSDFFLYVGRLSEEKGAEVMLQAFSAMPGRQLIVVGDGPDGEKLRAAFGHLTNVQFAGKKSNKEVLVLMQACRALIFPSICYEGLPLTIIEAFATGTPVIASKLGAMGEDMIQHGTNGLLFQKGNSNQLKEMVELFNKRIGEGEQGFYPAARESYLRLYHPDICYEGIMDIYKEVIDSSKTSGKN